jgi:hypothetical protein
VKVRTKGQGLRVSKREETKRVAEQKRTELSAWIRENQGASIMRFAIALMRMPDSGWAALWAPGIRATQLLSWVWPADTLARDDVRYRQPSSQEKAALQNVSTKAKELLIALQGARVLDGHSHLVSLSEDDVFVSWTRRRTESALRSGIMGPMHVSFTELLDALLGKCGDLMGAPPRAISDMTGGEAASYQRAFIRRLHTQIEHGCPDASSLEVNRTALAAAGAILQIELSPAELREILRDSPFRKKTGTD